MGEARRRRLALLRNGIAGPAPVNPATFTELHQFVDRTTAEAVATRFAMTTFETEAEFTEQLLLAGIAWFDLELDAQKRAKAQAEAAKGTPVIELVNALPTNLPPAPRPLAEVLRG